MIRFKIFVASALLLSALAAPPVLAQAAIQEPGSYAFYHPNSDVLNANRPGNSNGASAYAAMENGRLPVCAQRQESRKPGSRAVAAADNRQLRCD